MTSFIQTMFVLPCPPSRFAPKPLAPIYTLENSQAIITRLESYGDVLDAPCPPWLSSCPTSARWQGRPWTKHSAPMAALSAVTIPQSIRVVKSSGEILQSETSTNESPTEGSSPFEGAHKYDIHTAGLGPSHACESANWRTNHSVNSAPAALGNSPIVECTSEDKTEVNDLESYRNARARGPFKPQKSNRGTSGWQLRQFAEATLGSGSLRKAVKLPEGEDLNEWLAVTIVDFYNQINLLYGSITEFCSPQTCPEMKATDEFEYLWQDSENFKRPTKMPAPEYIEHLMVWCQNNIDNEQMFPSRIGVAFPKAFPSLVRQMFKRLYRVYAHIYCHHYPVILQLGLEPHLNTSFKHYVLFIDEHNLAQGKDFWGPLGDLVESMLKSD